MLVMVVIMFAVCYLPVHMYSIASLITVLPMEMKYVVMVSHWLCYFNSAVNPVIYNFMSGKFRNEFLRTFGCRRWATNRNRGHPMIRRRNQQTRFASTYGPRGRFKAMSTYIHAYYSSSEC